MRLRLVPKSVTLNDLEQRNGRYIALFHWIWQTCVPTHNRIDLWRNVCTSILYFVMRVYEVHVRYHICWWVSCQLLTGRTLLLGLEHFTSVVRILQNIEGLVPFSPKISRYYAAKA